MGEDDEMHPQADTYRVVIARGGTSKAVFVKENELPANPHRRDQVIRAIFGSPDLRQIDGLGGADLLTSKLAIIGPPTREDADVDYTFVRVGIESDVVDFKSNCGNISAAVGPFAIDEAMVKAREPVTSLRIHQTNSGTIILAEVPVNGGKAAMEGDCAIDGVPGTGARIVLDYADSAGSFTGKLLPTGNPKDVLDVEGHGSFEVSLIDAGNPHVFIRAESLGLKGTEGPGEIGGYPGLLAKVEAIRSAACVRMGLAKSSREAEEISHLPFIATVSAAVAYKCFNDGREVKSSQVDLVSRVLFQEGMHKTYPGTGTVCIGAAARIPGTIVHQLLNSEARGRRELIVGHPSGTVTVEAAVKGEGDKVELVRAAYARTARRIMEGYVYVRHSVVRS